MNPTANAYKTYPVWPSHQEPGRCFNCGNIFGEAPPIDCGAPPGHGQFQIKCRTCLLNTWYDVEPPKPNTRRQHVTDCNYCAQFKPTEMFPPHDASDRCDSGKHDHCSCDTCF